VLPSIRAALWFARRGLVRANAIVGAMPWIGDCLSLLRGR